MRKLVACLAIAIALSQLSGCMLIQASKKASEPGKGAQIPDNKVVVVGKISYPASLKQDFKPGSMAEKLWGGKMSIVFGRESEGKGKIDGFTEIKWGEYFLLLLPRHETSLMFTQTYIGTNFKGNTALKVFWRQQVSLEPQDCAVYIGDITVQFNVANTLGGKDNLIVVTDKLEEAEHALAEYGLLDESSQPVTLTKRIATGEKKAEVILVTEKLRAY